MTSVNTQQFKITSLKTDRYLWATLYYFNKKLCYYEVLNQVCRSCLTADVGSFSEQIDRQTVRCARSTMFTLWQPLNILSLSQFRPFQFNAPFVFLFNLYPCRRPRIQFEQTKRFAQVEIVSKSNINIKVELC